MVSEAPGLDTLVPHRTRGWEGFSLLDRSISPPCGTTWSPQSCWDTLQAWKKKKSRMDLRSGKEKVTPKLLEDSKMQS